MPAVIVAVAASAASYGVAAAIGGGILGAVVGSIAGGIVASVLGQAFGLNSQDSGPTASFEARGAQVNASSNVEYIPVIYGKRKVAGPRVLTEVSGPANGWLHLITVIGEGPIEAIDEVFLNDVDITDARFSGLVVVEKYLGTDGQAASAALIADLPDKWTTAHQLRGVAYIYTRLQWDNAAWPNGVPTITANVRGRKVYDPRTATTAWSDNPALCVRDYLTNTRYGRGIDPSAIDDDSFIAASNHCDEAVSVPDGNGGNTTQKRYTCNGLVDTSQTLFDNYRELLSSCRGLPVYSAGLHRLIIDRAETPSSFAFTEDNIVGAWQIAAGSKASQFSRVKANFFNPETNWQADIVTSDSQLDRAADNYLLLETEIKLPFTTNAYTAAQIAQIERKQSRFGLVAKFTATIAGLRAEVGAVVPITHSTPGWVSKPFRVMRMELLNSDEVEVWVREYQSSTYALEQLEAVRVVPASNLPNAFLLETPGRPSLSEQLYATTNSAGVKTQMVVTWTAINNAFVADYLVEYKPSADASWISLNASAANRVVIEDLQPGSYDVRLRGRNALGVTSAYSETSTIEMRGLTEPPVDVTNFSITASAGFAMAQWTLHPDLDVRIGGRIAIRHTPLTSGAVWENGITVREANGDAVSAVIPLMTGTYLVKARDSAGNWSEGAASFVATEGLLNALTIVTTITEDPTFGGTKTNLTLSGGAIEISGSNLTGSYAFTSTLDLTTVAVRRFEADIRATAFDTGDTIDGRLNNIDDWSSIDGTAVDGCDATLFVRTTNDDPSGSPVWGPWTPFLVAEFRCRGAQFRLDLVRDDPQNNISIDQLRVDVKVP
ncbi:MAG: phage tail protein [Pseudomonadota bacterium]